MRQNFVQWLGISDTSTQASKWRRFSFYCFSDITTVSYCYFFLPSGCDVKHFLTLVLNVCLQCSILHVKSSVLHVCLHCSVQSWMLVYTAVFRPACLFTFQCSVNQSCMFVYIAVFNTACLFTFQCSERQQDWKIDGNFHCFQDSSFGKCASSDLETFAFYFLWGQKFFTDTGNCKTSQAYECKITCRVYVTDATVISTSKSK